MPTRRRPLSSEPSPQSLSAAAAAAVAQWIALTIIGGHSRLPDMAFQLIIPLRRAGMGGRASNMAAGTISSLIWECLASARIGSGGRAA